MRTIALRFSDSFAPPEGTIAAHQQLITDHGCAWYGKLGSRVSDRVVSDVLANEPPRILLIRSGAAERYWAYIDRVQFETPDKELIPKYYRDRATDFKSWFRVVCFENAPRDILSKCVVASSGTSLSLASRHSMNPYFIINYSSER